MPDKIIVGAATVGATGSLEGALEGQNANAAAISGLVNDGANLSGNVVLDSQNVDANVNYNGAVSGQSANEGVASGAISIRIGQDGADGKDGFSPTIEVHTNTKTEYVLKITDVNGSYLTPNLYPDIEGLQDVVTLVAGKVDEDLLEYPVINPVTLTAGQREESYLYVNAVGLPRKIRLSDVALEQETNEKIKRKLQTVGEVPTETGWKVGDYILLENEVNENI